MDDVVTENNALCVIARLFFRGKISGSQAL